MRPRFGRPNVLRRRRDFLRVQTTGQRFRRRHMVLIVAEGEPGAARVGYTVSRKVGKAVVRNRVRRRLREIVRAHPQLLGEGLDHVIIAFDSAATAEFATMRDELTCLLQKAREWASSKRS